MYSKLIIELATRLIDTGTGEKDEGDEEDYDDSHCFGPYGDTGNSCHPLVGWEVVVI